MVTDRDGTSWEEHVVYRLVPQDLDIEKHWFAESFADAILIGIDGTSGDGTVVGKDSWGRIKASLAN